MKTLKYALFVLALGAFCTTSFAQNKQALKKKPVVQNPPPAVKQASATSGTVTPAPNTTQNKKKDAALNQNAPAQGASQEIQEGDDPTLHQNRGAISEQGMPSDQPKLKPATSVTPANTGAKPATTQSVTTSPR